MQRSCMPHACIETGGLIGPRSELRRAASNARVSTPYQVVCKLTPESNLAFLRAATIAFALAWANDLLCSFVA